MRLREVDAGRADHFPKVRDGIQADDPGALGHVEEKDIDRTKSITHVTGRKLDFIAANLEAPTTVLHYPTHRRFLRELRRGYDYVGIGFVMCTYPKALEMCRWVREAAPQTKIVLGGYGTVLEECDHFADFVCREEGVGFFKRLLGEEPVEHFAMPTITRKLKVMSVTTRPEAILPTGLGCSRGCDFCCTSHFFDRRTVPLLRTGEDIHRAMLAIDLPGSPVRNIGVIDEDFLADRRRIEPLIRLNAGVLPRATLARPLARLGFQPGDIFTIERGGRAAHYEFGGTS